MTSSVVKLTFLAFATAALVQAELTASGELTLLTGGNYQKLSDYERLVEVLVTDMRAMSSKCEKNYNELIAEKEKAYVDSHAAIDACQVTAANALATPPCLAKDVACQQIIEAFKVKILDEARSCMDVARSGAKDVVSRLKTYGIFIFCKGWYPNPGPPVDGC